MKKIIYCFIATVLFMGFTFAGAQPDNFNIKSYGNFKKMLQTKKAEGVVLLKDAIPAVHGYAVGELENGLGQITVIDSNVWLDYGKDFIGLAETTIPDDGKAALLVTAQVSKWKEIEIPDSLSEKQVYEFILAQAGKHGPGIDAPFPFLIEGIFDLLNLHVIDGVNPEYGKDGNKEHFFRKITQARYNQKAVVIGFYSADTGGVYTRPGESWHLHAMINKMKVAAHVYYIAVRKKSILKLPVLK